MADFLAELAALAEEAARAETTHRDDARKRQAALERERIAAHRRINFIRAMAAAVPEEPDAPGATMALAAARDSLGWESETEARARVLARLRPVADAIADALNGRSAPPVPAAMLAFEAWYREAFGQSFHDQFERYMAETPVVDF